MFRGISLMNGKYMGGWFFKTAIFKGTRVFRTHYVLSLVHPHRIKFS